MLQSRPHSTVEPHVRPGDVAGPRSNEERDSIALTDDATGSILKVVRAGEIGWVGLTIPKSDDVQTIIERLLARAKLSMDQLLLVQWFSTGSELEEQASHLPEFGRDASHMVMTQADGVVATVQMTFSAIDAESRTFGEASHGIAGVDVRLTRAGRCFSISGASSEDLGLVPQTRDIMTAIVFVLDQQKLTFSDVRKATTYYVAGGSAEELHDNMSVRNQYYSKPGPGSTGLPVFALSGSNALVSIRIFGKAEDERLQETGNGLQS